MTPGAAASAPTGSYSPIAAIDNAIRAALLAQAADVRKSGRPLTNKRAR